MIFGDAVFMVIYRNPTGRHLLVSFRGGWLNWLPASEDPNFQRLGAWWEGLPMGFAVLPGVAAPGHVYGDGRVPTRGAAASCCCNLM